MEKITVTIEVGEKNHSAFIERLPGCVATGRSISEIKENIKKAVSFHLSHCEVHEIPKEFKRKYEFCFQIEFESFLKMYKGIFSQTGLARATGINESLMRQYVTGKKKPRLSQVKKMEAGIHKLGQELMSVQYI